MISVSAQVISLLLAATGVRAGTSSVTCMAGTSWLNSHSGLDPCTLWAEMRSVCDPSGSSDVQPLSGSGTTYPPPSSSSSTYDCDCNADAYDLMASCSYCQGTSNSWPSVSGWSASCTNYADYWNLSDGYEKNATLAADVDIDIPLVDYGYRPATTWDAYDACTYSVDEEECLASTSGSSSGSSSSSSPMSGGPDGDSIVVGATSLTVYYIVVAIVLAVPALSSLIALIVCCVRQKHRRQFYQPLAAYYQNGGVPPASAWTSTTSHLAYHQPTYA